MIQKNYFYSILYVITTSLAAILIELIVRNISVSLSLLISTLFAIIFFNAINFHSLKSIYRKMLENKKSWIACNLLMAGIWLTTFYSTDLLSGFESLFIFFMTSAVLACVISIYSEEKRSFAFLTSSIGLAILLIIFIYSNLQHPDARHVFGIFLALSSGIFSYLYRKVSYHITLTTQLKSSQVLAVRSYGIILACVLLTPRIEYHLLTISAIAATCCLAILCLIIPTYVNQRGIVDSGPELHSLIAGSCPLVTCFFELMIRPHYPLVNLEYSLVGSILLVLSCRPGSKRENKR